MWDKASEAAEVACMQRTRRGCMFELAARWPSSESVIVIVSLGTMNALSNVSGAVPRGRREETSLLVSTLEQIVLQLFGTLQSGEEHRFHMQ